MMPPHFIGCTQYIQGGIKSQPTTGRYLFHDGFQRVTNIGLNLIHNARPDSEPLDVRIGLLEPIRLPADKDVKRVVFPAPRPFFEAWFGANDDAEVKANFEAQKAIAEALPADVRKAFRYVELFNRMERGEAMTMLPFDLEIK